jgi:O-antigen/teichoic acid export membrane protein
MEHTSAVARGASSLYLANIATLLAGTVYFILLTNLLHSTLTVGVVTAMNILIWFLVMFCVLATPIVNQNPIPAPLAVLKFIPELLAKNNRPGAMRVLRASLWIALIISLMIAGLLYLATPLVIPLLGGSAVLPNFVHLVGFDVVVVAVGQVGVAAVIALGKTNSAARSIWIWAIARYGLASILLIPLGVVGVLVGWILGDLTLVFFSLNKCLRENYAPITHSPIPFRSLMSYSGYNLAAALMGFAISFADRLFTLSTQGLSPLAVYNVAIMATTIASSASYALVTVMLPALAGLFAAQNLNELHRLVRLNTRYLSLLVMPIAFGLAAVMDVPLRVFGQAYMSGVGPAVIVCVASGLTAISAVYASALIALGKMRWFTAANLLGLVGFFVVTSVLTPKLGLSGPAFGRATLMIITTLVYGLVAFRAGVFEFDQKAYLISMASSTLMALLVFTAISMLHTFPLKLASLPFLMILGILTYFGLLRISHLISREDLEFIRDITPRRAHRHLPMIAAILGVRD